MTSQHSVIEHRANYFFLKMEEDYIEICQGKHKHCKAAILSILEHWMNVKRTATSIEDDLYIYMSYPQFVKRMFNLYGRNTVIISLEELEQEGLILKRPYTDQFNQDTFEYRLNIPVVQARLQALPDVPVRGSLKINGGSLKVNDPSLKTDGGSFENKLGGSPDLNGGSFKSKRNVDTTIDTNLDTSQISKEIVVSAIAENDAPAPINFVERKSDKYKAITKEEIASHSQVDIGNDDFADRPTEKRPAVKIEQTTTSGPLDAAQRTDSPPAGVGATSTSGAVQASIPKRPKSRKPPVMPDEQPQPKCDTREIQRRVNEHRGYALEEKVDIVRERQAIKTWCNLHTIEEYGLVMAGAKNDKYWGKQENYYRIGGLTLLKITPEILARQRQPLQLVSNGHNGHSNGNQDGLVYQGDLVLWQGQWMTEEEADKTGYNGGFGLYK